jgi:hypothetical protein
MMMTKKIVLSLCLLVTLLSVGCTGRVKVSGYVKFSDGEPLNFGEVCFTEGEKTFFGRIQENGYYAPGEFQDGDGIPPGKYQVWLARTVLAEPILNRNGEESDEVKQTERVDKKYTTAETTELTFEVKRGGSKKFDFTVERPRKTPPKPRR